jgi:formylglycine-generating enzyme required for sulfatase activity
MKLLSKSLLAAHFLCLSFSVTAQTLSGKVLNAKTKEPLPYANVVIFATNAGTITNEEGEFSISNLNNNDTLVISYVGFKTRVEKVSNLQNPAAIYLKEYNVELNEVSVSSKKLNPNDLLKSMRVIRDSLFASNTEVTNFEYNRFLYFSETRDGRDFDLSGYRSADEAYFKRYQARGKDTGRQRNDSAVNYNHYPAVNVTYEGAIAYCAWLTDEYNNSPGRKRYKKVKFRLPSLDEWRIAALGDQDFQSWKPEENFVMVAIPGDTLREMIERKKKKEKLWVKDEVWYPWWGAYHYRKKAQNHLNYFLGNFKEPVTYKPCLPPNGAPKGFKCPPFGDGWSRMSQTANYFPNNIGLYDVVGNVAEMIDERGKACGGSWNSYPQNATIWTVDTYTKASGTIGFRVFMEVVEE